MEGPYRSIWLLYNPIVDTVPTNYPGLQVQLLEGLPLTHVPTHAQLSCDMLGFHNTSQQREMNSGRYICAYPPYHWDLRKGRS